MATLPETRRVLASVSRVFGSRAATLRWVTGLLVACGALAAFFPFFWMAITSLKTPPEIQRVPLQILPDHWTNLNNYVVIPKTNS